MAFITLRQANVVASPGGTVKGSPLSNAEVDNNFANINIVIGFREGLTTTANANLVAAVNEIDAEVGNVVIDVGNVILLTTTTTSNTVAAINEVNLVATTANATAIAASAAAASIIPFAIALG